MNQRELVREIRKRGWNIDHNNIDFRRQDVTLWYGFDGEEPILIVSKDNHVIRLIATGDIRIYGERNAHFVFKGGNPDGELTHYLRKHGSWENNNWFEIDQDGSSYETFETPFYTLNDAVEELLSRLN